MNVAAVIVLSLACCTAPALALSSTATMLVRGTNRAVLGFSWPPMPLIRMFSPAGESVGPSMRGRVGPALASAASSRPPPAFCQGKSGFGAGGERGPSLSPWPLTPGRGMRKGGGRTITSAGGGDSGGMFDQSVSFEEMGLDDRLVEAVKKLGFAQARRRDVPT